MLLEAGGRMNPVEEYKTLRSQGLSHETALKLVKYDVALALEEARLETDEATPFGERQSVESFVELLKKIGDGEGEKREAE